MPEQKPRKRIGWKIVAVVLIALVVTGVIFYGYFYQQYQLRKQKDSNATFIKPRVELQQLHFKRFDGKDTKLDIDLKIHNPSPINVRVDSVHYKVFMAGKQIAESRDIDTVFIKSSDSTLVRLKLKLDNEAQKSAFRKATVDGNDSTEYRLQAEIFVDLPFFRGKSISYALVKILPAFMLPHVEMKKVHVDKAGLSKTQFTLKTEIVNPNPFPMRFKDGRYIFVIDDDTLKTGTVDYVVKVPARGAAPLDIPIEMKTGKALEKGMDLWLKPDSMKYYYYFESNMISNNPAFEEASAVTEARGKMVDLREQK